MASIDQSYARQAGRLWNKSTLEEDENDLRGFAATEAPLRAELFSADQMERHGRILAASHRIGAGYQQDQLLARLAENEAILVNACRVLTNTTNATRLTPAGEWLLDNFYLIEEQIRTAKRHFPKGYGRGLPRLAEGESAGMPRVYEIALEAIAHGDGRWDLESLSRYVSAYQQVSELTLGELWAIPIMLRLALIENLRRVSASIATDSADRNLAAEWASRMIKASEEDPKSLILLVADMARSGPVMGHTFVAELARRLQGQGAQLALPLTWIEQVLAEQGQTIEQMVLAENRQQSANQLSISNSISSLRLLGATNWREFVETLSVVEQILISDPAGMYTHMDFSTRDQYRHTVERTARRAHMAESAVARQAIDLAAAAASSGPLIDSPIHTDRKAHVGFYLFGDGLVRLEQACQAQLPFWLKCKRGFARAPVACYLGAISLITLGVALPMLYKVWQAGLTNPVLWVVLTVSLLLAASQLGVALINLFATHLAVPRFLPRLDYNRGIPPELRTLVVVPGMLSSVEGVERLVDDLEVRFLGNRDPHLHFALLTDFTDASEEHMPDDQALVALVTSRINALNSQYPSPRGNTFFLFHRPRRYNPREGKWMGYERKRGKLAALNMLLRDGVTEPFSTVIGHTAVLSNVKYVITLDTDTQLPRDAARQFVGTMAHPLNHPRYDEQLGRVVEGYGILQPRVAESLPPGGPSMYARLIGSEPGIDPYTRTVSDVYQDLFGEGSFIGKGIYDVATFEQALAGRFPENTVLSHDLLEGCYARSGLLSDVALYETSPDNYLTDIQRRTRWVRGDWQLSDWLFFKVKNEQGERIPNPLSILSRWKLKDNLRRSLVPLSLVVLTVLGATVLPMPRLWLGTLLTVLWLPTILSALLDLARKPRGITWRQHLFTNSHLIWVQATQLGLRLATLPHETWVTTGAILRTLWRKWFTHKHLLEWSTSEVARTTARYDLKTFIRAMWIGPVAAVAILVCAPLIDVTWLVFAAILAGLWLLSPVLAWWISQPPAAFATELDTEQTTLLRRTARKTWLFFETFVTAQEHWLPPDNFQEVPDEGIIAHRTSPTNIGLSLLANMTAYDFGYLCGGAMLERTTNTLNGMLSLERYRGHLYNWYDTRSLQPLAPRYVSTVDSGNLAGHLITLRQGLLALTEDPLIHPMLWHGLDDGIKLITSLWLAEAPQPLVQLQSQISGALLVPPASPADAYSTLKNLTQDVDTLCALIPDDAEQNELRRAAASVQRQCHATLGEIEHLMPWATWSAEQRAQVVSLNRIPLLRDLPGFASVATDEWHLPADLAEQVGAASRHARDRLSLMNALAVQALELAQMDYGFLYDPSVHLLAVGYNCDDNRRDSGRYDLLTSENRLCNFVAIAQGQLPQESWFALGRLLTLVDNEPVMVSWSGSMFEYLMPMLVMPTYPETLLDTTCRAAVRAQITYGKQADVPWGISESGYNTTDAHLNYQYRAFGVPGLGLKRGLVDDLVIAPYATVMALMVAPTAACQNLQKLSAMGAEGAYGYYEAIDYTLARLPRGQKHAMVRSFMAHHQGMAFLSLSYALLGQPMLKRFGADPQCQATMLLLQERVPKTIAVYARAGQFANSSAQAETLEASIREFDRPDTPAPEVQLLSNSRYHVMVNNAGSGYSRWKNMAVTRWQEDSTLDQLGVYCYLRDLETGLFWSSSSRPCGMPGENFRAIFSEAHAEFHRQDQRYDVRSEIVVSPEDDIELRRIRITNRARRRRILEVTSYAEVVIAPVSADNAHPAFSKLFVESEILPEQQAILCHRRKREQKEPQPYLLHLMAVHGADVDHFSCETDRARFIGRGNTLASPVALTATGHLSNTQGAVLDPVVSVRHHIVLEPEATVTLDLVLGMSDTRDGALALIEKYRDRRLADRVFDLAWTHNLVLLRQINASEADGQLYGRMAGAILYPNAAQRAEVAVLMNNRRGQSGLWGYAISGDLPIVLLRIADPGRIDLVRQLVQAHAYWRLKGLAVDLVILNEDHAGYRQALQDQIMGLISAGVEASANDKPGGVFVRNGEQMSMEDRTLLQTVARIIITDTRGSLQDQVTRRGALSVAPPPLPVNSSSIVPLPEAPRRQTLDLQYHNGTGGFSADGREYIISTRDTQRTPVPWSNMLANSDFGTMISESGMAYTWRGNAHEFRLSPWYNDPVQDTGGEAIYLRDEETGKFWSPTPLPARGTGEYITRHGFGYSVFEHEENGIRTELWVYVALDAPVKFSRLKIRNVSGRTRKLTVTGYVEWVLGDLRAKTAPFVVTEISPATGALYARNSYTAAAGTQVAFFDVDDPLREITADRREFIGRAGTHARPAAMERTRLSGRVGAALDPCGAIQVPFALVDGQEREMTFRLGAGQDVTEADSLVPRFRGNTTAADVLDHVQQYWQRVLGAVQVQTPDPSINLMANGWLVYQVLACRLWGRSGYYQSGGAFGYRDQIQDTMALVHAEPVRMREHVLLCASRQFMDGDVQHWWHPPTGAGVRTRCSDDYLWLPMALCRYVETTGDMAILDETVPYLTGRPLNPDEENWYDLPGVSDIREPVYQHGMRAILHGLRYGPHGIPLMGSGDWNDGMNLVGEHGVGESVWLGFFLYEVLCQYGKLARQYGDAAFAERCAQEAAQLQQSLETHAWDGEWYKRAWFDDGTPLGTATNTECRIDSIAQSWSVLSGAGDPIRAQRAMQSLNENLVRRPDKLIQLLDPPFDKGHLEPGYIKGYVPGVRENGGQYTHAAVWTTMAFAHMGDTRNAWELMNLINPINHARDAAEVAQYKVEPYVAAADVYGVAPHTGRGGWTWYTGSAGWMYRLIVESLLGVHREADTLRLTPLLPPDWPGYELTYHFGQSTYRIHIRRADQPGVRLTVDGEEQDSPVLPLKDDHAEHWVELQLGQQ
ncbi:GH36-type glycosyl hydrolase domain-containing protein [Silvimonas amylolytica]|uniref:Cyclic beta 1-2 glucan synthetase n=1 Tax=Silvimonas amylolytica TaxID=449663 RepID=A0ABQ2PKU0_9NEIS|nr:glucoamylase family protein [Silvimonas amylolytica]GGP25958.1 cyclic beta 1-2 glucan synthetase [Silvimonas amylolytica]